MNPFAIAWRVYGRHIIDGHALETFIGPAIGTDAESVIHWIRESHPEITSRFLDSDLRIVPVSKEILQGASEATEPHKLGEVGSTPTPAPNLPAVESGAHLPTHSSQPPQHAASKTRASALRVGGLALVTALATTAAVGGQPTTETQSARLRTLISVANPGEGGTSLGTERRTGSPQQVVTAGETAQLSPPQLRTALVLGSTAEGFRQVGVGNPLPEPNMGRHAIGPATSGRDATLWRESVGWQPEPGAGSRVAGYAPSRPERLGYLSGTRRGSGPAYAGKFNSGARLKAVSAGQMLNQIACDMIAPAVGGNPIASLCDGGETGYPTAVRAHRLLSVIECRRVASIRHAGGSPALIFASERYPLSERAVTRDIAGVQPVDRQRDADGLTQTPTHSSQPPQHAASKTRASALRVGGQAGGRLATFPTHSPKGSETSCATEAGALTTIPSVLGFISVGICGASAVVMAALGLSKMEDK